GDPAVGAGDVRDVRLAVERNEVVLADREHCDVTHHHHLVVVGLERDDEVPARVVGEATRDLLVHARDPARRAEQTVTFRVLADRDQDLAHGLLDAVGIDREVGVRNRVQRVRFAHQRTIHWRGKGERTPRRRIRGRRRTGSAGDYWSGPAYSAMYGRFRYC